MFSTEIRRMSGVLAGAIIIWLFGQTLLISPLVIAVQSLVDTNKEEHNLIIDRLEAMGNTVHGNKTRIDKNEVKLFRVIDDSNEHHHDIRNCQAFHSGEIK